MKDEALKLALYALEFIPESGSMLGAYAEEKRVNAIIAIKQALAAQPAPVEPDWKAEYLKSVESGCITLDELRETLAELEATNRQVEILSDALAESRREVAALKAVQEPVVCKHEWFSTGAMEPGECRCIKCGVWNTTPPPAEFVCSTGLCHYKAQRQWVGLTDKQMVDAIEPLYQNRATAEMAAKVSMDEFRAIEAKLKEKNNG